MSDEERTSTTPNEPRRHHYIPQFQLKRFADEEGLLEVYDRRIRRYHRAAPKVVAFETDLYAFVDNDGQKNRSVESAVTSAIDGPISAIFDALEARRPLSDKERADLALFVSFQAMRTPATRDLIAAQLAKFGDSFSKFMFADEERATAVMRQYEEATGDKSDITPKQMVEFVQSDASIVKANKGAVLKIVLGIACDLAPSLAALDWRVLVASGGGSFILSDQPFVAVLSGDSGPTLSGGGFLIPGSLKFLPLTPSICLEMGQPGGRLGFVQADRKLVRTINLNTARNSQRFVIGSSRPHLESVLVRAGATEAPDDSDRSDVQVFQADYNSEFMAISSKQLPAFFDDRMGWPQSGS